MSRYRQMEVFAAVAQAGSLAAAARDLALSPATVMRTLAALEARLGTVLLVRGPRGVQLNAVGERFAAQCRLILEETAAAERSAAGLHSHIAGPLTVALPLLMAHQLFMPLAVAYLEAFPDVQLTTCARERTPKLLEEGIDVALVVGTLPDSSGFAVPIGRVRPMMCAAPRTCGPIAPFSPAKRATAPSGVCTTAPPPARCATCRCSPAPPSRPPSARRCRGWG